jgi:hypothetical protein
MLTIDARVAGRENHRYQVGDRNQVGGGVLSEREQDGRDHADAQERQQQRHDVFPPDAAGRQFHVQGRGAPGPDTNRPGARLGELLIDG